MKAAASRQQRPTAGPFQIAPTSAPPPRALGAQVVAEEANQGWPRHSTPGWLSVAFPLARAALRSQRQVQRSPLVLGPPKPSRALSLLGTGCGGPHKNSRTSIATAPLYEAGGPLSPILACRVWLRPFCLTSRAMETGRRWAAGAAAPAAPQQWRPSTQEKQNGPGPPADAREETADAFRRHTKTSLATAPLDWRIR